MTMVRANGITLHTQRLDPPHPPPADGSAPMPTAVLIHGMASDTMASWYFTLAEPLAAAGFPVVLYDLRGHGRSDRPATGYALADFVDDLAGLLTELDVTGPVLLCGNSFGGTIAFGYAARHPDRVAGIVAVESAPPIEEWMARVKVRLARVVDRLPREGAVAEIGLRRGRLAARRADDTRRMLTSTTLAEELPASALPPADQLAAIGCPVLCLYGGRSAVHELAPSVRSLLPQARTVVLPEEKHTVLIDQPEQVRRHVFDWLAAECALPAGGGTPAGRGVAVAGGLAVDHTTTS
ncbi:alpha/beta hydrolase [Micromonospora sagamiensis]|uniref:Alpha-beta hydrolase superfamily lysophospholipase n=2 Tax=Micromonospora sagamiensis TaxID=47875 RepID=A0A562WPY6_9ACTN|nr:alpha-beta hydrolase superfamily lysophospholipase [Micromonospora sagamiensis]BCL15478.1 alpha/beta hydrolase [Micromonospora sagamiensis]